MSTDRVKNSFSEWSETVNGLCGRLRVKFEDLKPGLRHAIYLELRNISLAPIAISNQPDIQAELFDSSHKPIAEPGVVDSGPGPILQWAVIPRDAYIGVRVDMQTAGIPTKEHKRVFLGLGASAWELIPGRYLLYTTAIFKPEESGPANQWVGEIKLPPVEVVVTEEMFNT